nr:zinc finger protein with KRAB and SCAN domains 5-like [Dermacentor andersoni]
MWGGSSDATPSTSSGGVQQENARVTAEAEGAQVEPEGNEEGGPSHKCQVCEQTFARKTSLLSHQLTHSCERPHECSECGKKFARKSYLTRHLHTHAESRPVTAEAEGAQVEPEGNEEGGPSHKCQVCEETFARKTSLLSHQLTLPGGHVVKMNEGWDASWGFEGGNQKRPDATQAPGVRSGYSGNLDVFLEHFDCFVALNNLAYFIQ